MARKKAGKHSKTPAATSATARRSHVALGAATAVVGASLALGVTPAFAQTGVTPAVPAQPGTPAAQPAASANNKPANPQTPVVKQGDKKQVETKADKKQADTAKKNERGGVSSTKPAAASNGSVTPQAPETVQGKDRDANPAPAPKPQANSTVELSQDKKDILPNMYAWGRSDNVYIESGQNQEVTFKFAKPSDGSTITKVAIFPDDNIDIHSNTHSKDYAEYYSADGDWHKPYSGKYAFTTSNDGSATLKMTNLYRDGGINGAQGYAANRCVYVYGMKDGQEVLLYKTNIARAATLIPPKKTGSIVLRYDQKLEEKQIQEKLKEALDAPTEAKDKKTSKPLSLRDQITAASQAFGVGVRGEDTKKVTTPDDPDKKIVITDKRAYDDGQLAKINQVTSKTGEPTTYVTGVNNLKTYLVSDLGYKSEALALTVARYDTRIDKPIVADPNNLSADVKKEIAKKLANLNHVAQDKVTVNADGTVTINFEGVDPSLAPTLKLSDLVLKQLEETDVNVPTGDKATFVANPLGYSNAELDRIKQSILDANKDNKKLGLTSKDQITLSYIEGDTVTAGHKNQGISNGQAENKITVKIKTDKAVAEFTSNVKESKLTKLPNIRTDYDVSWTKTKIDDRDTDEGISWSNDSKTTIIYRYDPTAAKELKTDDIIKLLKATPKDGKSGLRELQGGEALDHEDVNGKPRKSHMKYALKDDEPTGELSLGNMSGAYWIGDQKVDHSDESLGDEQSSAGSYTWDKEAGSVTVAGKGVGKNSKIYKARLFVQPYAMSYYKDVYLEQGSNPGNTTKAINVIFVPQTNHKKADLKTSIEGHKLADDKKTPTESKYYNASDKVKKDYEDALTAAKDLYEKVKDTDESKLTEQQKADIDNATIKLDKARKALDGEATKKDELTQSIDENGKAAEGSTAATPGTVTTDKYKNVTEPDFKKADGSADTERNEAAKKAKEDYDKALEEAKALKDDDNATQKAVDAAKAKLDAAREKLNDFTTNKDELNAAIAAEGTVNTGDADKTGEAKLKTADPTYQNSSEQDRKAYDDAVTQANKVVADPNASQKEVNAAIDALQKAKAKLDAKATDKSKLAAAEKQSFDNPKPDDASKQSVFYKNAKNKKDNGASESEKQAAAKAVKDYDDALDMARKVLNNEKATQAQVDEAKQKLEAAEAALHADTYATDKTDLAKALADNFSGYLMPAYFNAFDKAQKDGKDSQAAKDFKAYNDAYHAAKDLMEKLKQPGNPITQAEADKIKDQLIAARKIIDTYATDTSKLSAATFNDLAIKLSPAYKNVSADDASEAAKAAKKKYDEAVEKLHKALNNQLPKDQADGADIPDSNIPDKDGDLTDKNYLKNIQAHKNGEPLDRDVTDILKEMNDAKKELDKFATKTDELIKSINKDSDTHQSPAFKNAAIPVFQKADSTDPDATKNDAAKKAVDDYGKALNEAKDLLKDPTATQAQVNAAKKKLDDARTALDAYKTDTTKLTASVGKHGKEKQGETAATEGTVTSDAYRNASDPHFMKEEDGKLVPDTEKNKKAADDKTAYDKALAKAQELLKKHDSADTPQDAKPTQQEINDALKTLDEARKKLEDNYKTDTSKLDNEAKKSTADGGTLADADFEATPEFKNADAKKGEDNKDNDDVKAYKEALKAARDLVKAATEPGKKNSERPTQQQIDEALETLKQAKQAITDGYKTNVTALKDAKELANGGFKNTPEYKNAAALKDNQNADAEKKNAAKTDVEALDENTNDGALKKAKDILDKFDEDGKLKAGQTSPTQAEVDAALKTLQDAMDKVTKDYKTDAKLLSNEVGDKDQDGKDVTPPFEASVPYKNALEKAKTEDPATTDPESATVKLKDYADKLKAAQDLIAQVNSTDPNADPDKKPTQAQVDQALTDLKAAKDAITNGFKTNAKDLKKETKELKDDGQPKDEKDQFEKSTEYKNALAKTDADSKKDVQTYKDALKKANELLQLFNDDGTPKADIPAGKQIPTQQEVDEAQKALKEIKDKILANYKTNPVDLQKEVDLSKDGDDDKRDDVFENTPAFKNATAKGDDASKQALKDYNDKLAAAKDMLEKFDRTTGQPKKDLPAGTKVPTQKEMDDALKALQDAKAKIETDYATQKQNLRTDYGNSPDVSNYGWASDAAKDAYKKALEDANAKLGDTNATQAEVDAAQKALKDALEALVKSANANRRAYYEDMVIDARNALQKLVDANEATHLKDLYTHAEPAAQHEFMAAMDNAKKVLADKEALASELDAARVRLLRALDGLAAHQLPGMTNAGANGNAGAGANGAAGYGAHAAGAYGRGAHAAGRVRAHAGKHLAQTSDPTNALAAAGMLASALGFIAMGFKTKKRRAK